MNSRGNPFEAGAFRASLASIGLSLCALLAASSALAQHYVPGAEPKFPKLKYADSLISLNDRCIVSKEKLNPKARPVYVNSRPIGFC